MRAFQSGDSVASLLELCSEVFPAERIDREKWVRNVFLDANFRSEGLGVVEAEGKTAGLVVAFAPQTLEGASASKKRGYVTLLGVRRQWENQGFGASLLAFAEDYLRECGCGECWVSPYSPGYFAPGVDVAAYGRGLQFLARKGYVEVSRPISMAVDLRALTPPDWVVERRSELGVQGVEVREYSEDWLAPLIEFARKEFHEDWARFVRSAAEDILRGGRNDRLIFLEERGEVRAFSHYNADRFGPIGVASEERGRGLGHVLMFETLKAQKESGQSSAYFLWSDLRTADRLYNAAGFKVVRTFATLRKELV
ncbi:MAG: Mycothiol acetyltransferase [Armatimonadetes bacterium OLB18]|nr:MAG: Mycothiol acetyltransferase [Armatimonadetes bacterium OLB18]